MNQQINQQITKVKSEIAIKYLNTLNEQRMSTFGGARVQFQKLLEITKENPFGLCMESFEYQNGFNMNNIMGFDIKNGNIFIMVSIIKNETFENFLMRIKQDVGNLLNNIENI